MSRTLEEVRKIAMELSDEDRADLGEELVASAFDPAVLRAWIAESERRLERMETGEDPGLTLEKFLSDED